MSCEKVPYQTERCARKALKAIREQTNTRRRDARKPERCYRCPICDQWHLASRKPTPRKAP